MADVGSKCETDYDCKPRNFCWEKNAVDTEDQKVCLEKHTAPDKIEFKWHKDTDPTETTEAVLKHGQYCQSGVAKQSDTDENVAICVTIQDIRTASATGENGNSVGYPYACNPDGSSVCQYYKDNEL